jgi:transcriptional regulator with XRE-family HTH domain
MTDLEIFGAIIRQARIAKGLTLRQVGDAAGVGYNKLSRIERGEVDARLTTMIRIYKALDMPTLGK